MKKKKQPLKIPHLEFISKRRLVLLFVFLGLSTIVLGIASLHRFMVANQLTLGDLPLVRGVFPSQKVISERIVNEVLPKEGFHTKIRLGNSIPKLISYGVIDKQKFVDLYKSRGNLSIWQRQMLDNPSNTPLVINEENAQWLVNILWPIGLSNKMEINIQSPVAGADINNFASTGGWSLGKEETGGAYFNKYPIINLNPKQEQHVKYLAERIYRPCCNNSTFFQDCNHGSATLGLIELGVSQGLSDKEIYKTALAFNAFWFPQNYVETALYLKHTKGTDWNDLDPKLILSKKFSSIGGWLTNIDSLAQKIPGLLPATQNGGSCGA